VDRFELAWAAGFFDGEGWANAVGASGRRTKQPYARINQADPNGVPEVLLRFQRALGGLGRVGGPYLEQGRKDIYRWHVSSRGDVELLHHFLLPWLGQVKLVEFGQALGRPPARSRAATGGDEWRAWAAGFYDGEGSTYLLDHRTHQGYKIAEITVTQSSTAGAPEVLLRLSQICPGGHLNGPYPQEDGNLDVYRWKVSSRAGVEFVVTHLWSWLSTVKRAQASAVTETLGAQAALPRGRPDWGNRKTHCIRGHEYATARVRPYRSRGVGIPPRDSHQCLVCVREQARAKREQKKRSAADDDRRSLSDVRTRYLLK
jgi:hypothetical protein